MLQTIRSSIKGAFKWVFVILGILAFSLVGVGQLTGGGSNATVKVGDIALTGPEFETEFNRIVRLEGEQQGQALTREEALEAGLRERTIEDVSVKLALLNEIDELGLTMPRPLVQDILSQNELFQNPLTGKFDQTVLDNILRNNRLTPSQFDRLIREDLLRQNLLEAVSTGTRAPRSLAEIYLARETEARSVSWISITEDMTGEAAEPTEDELRAFHAANAATYTEPERRTLAVAFLRNRDFEAGLDLPEDDIRATYDANRQRLYEKPERRTLYQLTYDSEPDAEAAVARLRAGTPFETLALEKGSTLEAVTLTQTSQEEMLDDRVAEAAFSAPAEPGTVLDPVKGLFGATVLQIVETTPAEQQSYEAVRDDIRSALLAQKTQRLIYDKLETIEVARDSGANLIDAAAEADVELTMFENIDRFSFGTGGEIIDGIPGPVLAEAFAFDIDEGTDAIEIGSADDPGSEGYAIAYVSDITPASLKDFESVREQVETAWRRDERRTRIATYARSLVARLEAGETLKDIGDELERAPTTETLEIRSGAHPAITDAFRTEIFKANEGEALSGRARGGESNLVLVVDDIQFNRGDILTDQFATYRQVIGMQLNQELLGAYIADLQNTYGVSVNSKRLDQLFNVDG